MEAATCHQHPISMIAIQIHFGSVKNVYKFTISLEQQSQYGLNLLTVAGQSMVALNKKTFAVFGCEEEKYFSGSWYRMD